MNYETETVAFFKLLGRGTFMPALHDSLALLEKAIAETGKAGELTVKIKVVPDGRNKRVVSFTIGEKLPTLAEMPVFCWVTQQGQFVENDPEQMALPLNTVPMTPEKPLVAVGGV